MPFKFLHFSSRWRQSFFQNCYRRSHKSLPNIISGFCTCFKVIHLMAFSQWFCLSCSHITLVEQIELISDQSHHCGGTLLLIMMRFWNNGRTDIAFENNELKRERNNNRVRQVSREYPGQGRSTKMLLSGYENESTNKRIVSSFQDQFLPIHCLFCILPLILSSFRN
jgi:hypothetical protein